MFSSQSRLGYRQVRRRPGRRTRERRHLRRIRRGSAPRPPSPARRPAPRRIVALRPRRGRGRVRQPPVGACRRPRHRPGLLLQLPHGALAVGPAGGDAGGPAAAAGAAVGGGRVARRRGRTGPRRAGVGPAVRGGRRAVAAQGWREGGCRGRAWPRCWRAECVCQTQLSNTIDSATAREGLHSHSLAHSVLLSLSLHKMEGRGARGASEGRSALSAALGGGGAIISVADRTCTGQRTAMAWSPRPSRGGRSIASHAPQPRPTATVLSRPRGPGRAVPSCGHSRISVF
jgi:hypothetical protein